MPELLRIKTADFLFTVKATSIENRKHVLNKTFKARNSGSSTYALKLMPALDLSERPKIFIDDSCSLFIHQNQLIKCHEIDLIAPIFFENTIYQIEWFFLQDVETAALTHRSQNLCDAFIFTPSEKGINTAKLTGAINTGNDVGWMRLPLIFEREGNTYTQNIAFEVLPTKMALHQDLPAMYQTIDQTFPLWRFSLVEKTEQNAAQSKQRGHFPLMWLANFSQLRERFEQGLKVICAAPHSRLQPTVMNTKAARLKGRLPYKLGEKVKQDFANGQYDKHYRVEKKQLSLDTPENRLIKMAVSQCKTKLAEFEERLRSSNEAPDQLRLSEAFLTELHTWQQPLKKVLGQSFLKDVGTFSGLKHESLVLQQKTGYSAVYQVWQELKFYLDVFGYQSSISMKSVAEIYEIWCFLCLKQILENDLNFELRVNNRAKLSPNAFFEYQLKDGFAGAFEFKRPDGVTARLAHEPLFSKTTKPIKSYLVNQKPDIVLEVTLPATDDEPKEKQFIWLFDAKYRIKTDKSRFEVENIDSTDYVPDDAINQMHRYRDALIRLSSSQSGKGKSRPVFGAFALYPGFFDQAKEINPYADSIEEIGIGAFALLPSMQETTSTRWGAQSCGHVWLLAFLQSQIGGNASQKTSSISDYLYAQEATRIPYDGMQQVLYPDLTMTVALGNQRDRNNAYFEAFEQDTAEWYHIPQKTFLAKFKQHIAEEIRYLALALTSDTHSATKQIDKIWPVKRVSLLPRHAITEQQAGKKSSLEDLYYLFELGKPLKLKNAVTHVPQRSTKNSMKLTTLTLLEKAEKLKDVDEVYQEVMT